MFNLTNFFLFEALLLDSHLIVFVNNVARCSALTAGHSRKTGNYQQPFPSSDAEEINGWESALVVKKMRKTNE